MTAMAWMRKYGWLVFLLPFALYWIDDFATNWHHGGTQAFREIAWDNLKEDITIAGFWLLWIGVQRFFARRPLHCLCPHCHFEWTTYANHLQKYCPRCGKPEQG